MFVWKKMNILKRQNEAIAFVSGTCFNYVTILQQGVQNKEQAPDVRSKA